MAYILIKSIKRSKENNKKEFFVFYHHCWISNLINYSKQLYFNPDYLLHMYSGQ